MLMPLAGAVARGDEQGTWPARQSQAPLEHIVAGLPCELAAPPA